MVDTTQAAAGQVEKTVEQALNLEGRWLDAAVAEARGEPILYRIETPDGRGARGGPLTLEECQKECDLLNSIGVGGSDWHPTPFVRRYSSSWADAMALRDVVKTWDFHRQQYDFLEAMDRLIFARSGWPNTYHLLRVEAVDYARAFWLVCPAKTNVEGQ